MRRDIREHAVAGDEVKLAAHSRGELRFRQVGRQESDVPPAPGASLQALCNRDGGGAEIHRHDLRLRELAAYRESLSPVSTPGYENALRCGISSIGSPNPVDPFQRQPRWPGFQRPLVSERIRPLFINAADSIG